MAPKSPEGDREHIGTACFFKSNSPLFLFSSDWLEPPSSPEHARDP